jgi:hypothetical protein
MTSNFIFLALIIFCTNFATAADLTKADLLDALKASSPKPSVLQITQKSQIWYCDTYQVSERLLIQVEKLSPMFYFVPMIDANKKIRAYNSSITVNNENRSSRFTLQKVADRELLIQDLPLLGFKNTIVVTDGTAMVGQNQLIVEIAISTKEFYPKYFNGKENNYPRSEFFPEMPVKFYQVCTVPMRYVPQAILPRHVAF